MFEETMGASCSSKAAISGPSGASAPSEVGSSSAGSSPVVGAASGVVSGGAGAGAGAGVGAGAGSSTGASAIGGAFEVYPFPTEKDSYMSQCWKELCTDTKEKCGAYPLDSLTSGIHLAMTYLRALITHLKQKGAYDPFYMEALLHGLKNGLEICVASELVHESPKETSGPDLESPNELWDSLEAQQMFAKTMIVELEKVKNELSCDSLPNAIIPKLKPLVFVCCDRLFCRRWNQLESFACTNLNDRPVCVGCDRKIKTLISFE